MSAIAITTKHRIMALSLALLGSLQVSGQTCTTATCTAASTSESDVLAALPSNSNANATVVVNIPAGTGLWTSQLTYTIPAAVTSLTIQGATVVNCTGTAGTSGYACTATDNTIIQDNIAGSFGLWQFFGSSGGSAPLLRFTGITLQGGTGLSKGQGLFLLYSQNNGSQIRIDHNHINETTYTGGPGTFAGRINGCWIGVIDHNVFDNASTSSTTSVVQGFDASNACNDSLGYGDGSWAFATGYGTSNFLFQESNVFNGGLEGDCDTGGKFVSRYNTLNSNSQSSSWVHSHGTEQNGGRARGCRAYEAYHDYFNVAGSGSVLFGGDAGTSIAWGNTVNHTTALFSSYGDERNDGGHPQTSPPNGWGFCGTTAGGGSAWDGNSNTASGWPCLDGLGRGQGQALNGANFPGALNSVTGTIAWPHQNLEPVYQWMNTLAGTPQITITGTAAIQNRDLFVDNASFTGATGTGFGLLSARPATCTAGPGGTFGTSPTGSYGVGYWATDTNTFYVCSSTNTWTSIYTPYTYPHPLTVGGGVALTVSATNGSVSGANGSTGSYASGTTVGPLSATPNTGYSFAGWSSTGSASCSGTGTCGPFSLTATTSITASFTLNSWTLTTATAGSGSGTITGCSGAHNYASSFSCTVTATSGTITSVSGCGGSGTTTFAGTMPNNACTVTATFSNTLATPTFTPPAGTYGAAQWVTINSPAGTSVFNATEGSNGNSSNGDAPSRNLYTNCAEGWNGSALTPTGVPVGDLYCNATDKAAAIAAGGPNLGVVTSANSGTGIHAVQNGQDAGGTDSAASLTATYGQANQNGCPIGTNVSTSIPGVTLPGNVSAANTTYGITTQSGNFNTSLLAPTKWTYSGGDSGLYWVRETCQKVNTTSIAGEHLEYDANYNTTAGVYIGQGWDFDFPNSKFRFDPQGGSWHNVKLVANDGTVTTTYSWPANHWIYTQIWMHHVAACNTGPASGCTFFYDQLCTKDFTAGTPLACYNLIDANTSLTPTGTAVSKTTWTRNEFALQHQWDVNGSSATLTNTVDFDNLVAFSFAPNVFYTVDGSTPTTGSTPYYLPVAVPSNLTIKALANQSGFTNSAVGSAAYVISPSNTLTTSATNGSVSGSNCATGSYATGSSIGACTATPNAGYTFTGWTGSGACSGASGTGTASCTLSTNATLTASFAPILTCGDPAQLSPNFSGTYIVPPTTLPMAVGFTSPTSGCAMHYTSDGSSPTCGSTAYPGGDFSITVAGTYQYRVIACQGGYTSSAVVGGTWQVNAASGTTSVMDGRVTLSGQQGVQ